MNAFANGCMLRKVVTEAESDEQSHWSYCSIAETCSNIDLGEYHTYGIRVKGCNLSEILHDVSSYKDTIVWMTESFNKHQLSPIHFMDVVEDMLP